MVVFYHSCRCWNLFAIKIVFLYYVHTIVVNWQPGQPPHGSGVLVPLPGQVPVYGVCGNEHRLSNGRHCNVREIQKEIVNLL